MPPSSTTQAGSTPGTKRAQPAVVVALLVVTALFVLMQLSAAIALITPINTAPGTDATFVLSTVFNICYAAGSLIRGLLAGHYGRRQIMFAGLTRLTRRASGVPA